MATVTIVSHTALQRKMLNHHKNERPYTWLNDLVSSPNILVQYFQSSPSPTSAQNIFPGSWATITSKKSYHRIYICGNISDRKPHLSGHKSDHIKWPQKWSDEAATKVTNLGPARSFRLSSSQNAGRRSPSQTHLQDRAQMDDFKHEPDRNPVSRNR